MNSLLQRLSAEKVAMRGLARKSDPETSKIAARKLVKSGAHKTQCDRVYEALKQMPEGGTAKEIALRCGGFGIVNHVVLKRLPDLMKKGIAFKTKIVRDGQTVWKAE